MSKPVSGEREWGDVIYRRPAPDEIRRLEASHGWEACCERWSYLTPRTLASIKSDRQITGRQSLRKVVVGA